MYHHLLVPIDGSPTAERGQREALALAAELKARVSFLNVVDDYLVNMDLVAVATYPDVVDALRRKGEEVLSRAAAAAAAAGVQAQTLQRSVTSRRVADVIMEEATQQGCDLIVMGTHGRRGIGHFMLGSDAEHVVRRAPVPVLLIRQPGQE
jgi:nucleotide-binding universal stress UspA family protein